MATVAAVYAKALFELGQEKKALEAVAKELREFQDTVASSKALSAVLTNPGYNPGSRKAILADVIKAMGTEGLAKSLLELLDSRTRMAALPAILRELDRMIEESQGVWGGEVRSAVELSAEELAKLELAVGKRVGKKVRLAPKVDASLLGGVIANVAGKTFDASLRSQLERFKNEII
jgi:F-type H+-transporting ATPase subunit delta